jgi:uncharacterized protein YndB with AHSA1/START domain
MAVTETHVAAPPERCFEVLRDPRSYAYWVVGSQEIRAADPDWPAIGSKFHHTVGAGPVKPKDHTVVEDVETNRRLRLRAKARPFGTAFVTVTMTPEDGGTRLRLKEEPADRATRLLFTPLADRLLHARNEVSVDRLKELAEGTVPIPSGDLDRENVDGSGPVPRSRERGSDAAAGFGRGFIAGLAGGVAMSASTVAEMKLTGRGPSTVPARALERILGIQKLGRTGESRISAAAHFVVSGLTGGIWGAIASGGRGGPGRAPLLFVLAASPDAAIVPAMGLAPPTWRWSRADVGRTVLHHAVYTAVAYPVYVRLED